MKSKKEDLLIFSVDDDKDERFFIKEAFMDFVDEEQLRFFTNGLEVIDALAEGKVMPDVIMMDLNMPLMNGREALEIIKKNPVWKDIPVVIFSTSNYELDVAKCMAAGAKKYICKPASMMEYPKIFNNLINELITQK
ncbi:MAG: two-component system response regulator [Bacteroidetes bacterium]|jgi:CheY-like chemotaxis protein|nr:two-component system response regulator [Bacteroidota bacterium]